MLSFSFTDTVFELGAGTKAENTHNTPLNCAAPLVVNANADFGTLKAGSHLLFAFHRKYGKTFEPALLTTDAPFKEVLRAAEEAAQKEGASIYREEAPKKINLNK